MDEASEPDDPDRASRNEALRFVARRTAIWAGPLAVLAALLTALGIPLWISIVAMVIVLVAVVLELDI